MFVFFSEKIISISIKLWENKYIKTFHKCMFYNFAKLLKHQSKIFCGDQKNNVKKLWKKVTLNLQISQQKNCSLSISKENLIETYDIWVFLVGH